MELQGYWMDVGQPRVCTSKQFLDNPFKDFLAGMGLYLNSVRFSKDKHKLASGKSFVGPVIMVSEGHSLTPTLTHTERERKKERKKG